MSLCAFVQRTIVHPTDGLMKTFEEVWSNGPIEMMHYCTYSGPSQSYSPPPLQRQGRGHGHGQGCYVPSNPQNNPYNQGIQSVMKW